MNILVTGAAGFLGSHLVERLLADGHKVLAVDNLSTGRRSNLPQHENLEIADWDVCDPILPSWVVQRIYHLACPASPVAYQKRPLETLRTAFNGTDSILTLAVKYGTRVLMTSTSEVYGDPEVHPQKEDYWGRVNPLGPRSSYDEGKRAAEALARAYCETFPALDIRIARVFNTYGPRLAADDGRIVSNFCMQVLRGEPLTIYGDGRTTRSLCYVSDMVDGLVAFMEESSVCRGRLHLLNLGNPQEMTLAEIAHTVLRVAAERGCRLPEPRLQYLPTPADDPRRRCPDISRAMALIGWAPRVTLEEGIARTLDYFQTVLRRRVA